MAWRNEEIKYDILKTLGIICETRDGWHKEINIVSWNNGQPKVDIRDWSPDHKKMGRGINLTDAEAEKVCMVLHNYFAERSAK